MSDGATTLLYRFLGIDAGAGAQFDRMAAKTGMLGEASKRSMFSVRSLALGVGSAGAVIGVASVAMAVKYQRAMTLIQTQAGATATQVKGFSKALLDMAPKVGTGPDQLATALYHAFSVTHQYAQSLQITKIAAEGAKVGNASLEETINSLTATVASGIKGTKNYGQAMGVLTAIVGAGDMKLTDLNEAMSTGVLAAAKVFNVSLQQAGAALAVFGDNNIRGAEAGTKLRMVFQDLAKPAAHADEVLSRIKLTSGNLRDALAHGGLTEALQELAAHMTAAGITAGKVGPFIEQAFTKKAGVGLAVLIEQMTRYEQKLQATQAGAAGFGNAWAATTHTAAFAFDQLKATAESAMIALGTRLLPVVTSVAHWLSTGLPNAVARLQSILRPFEQIVGVALTFAWRTLGDVLRVVGTVLGEIGHALESIKGPLTDVAVAVAAMWLAFKGYQLAKTALLAVDAWLGRLASRASSAAGSMSGFGSSLRGMSTAAQIGMGALGGLGLALGVMSAVWQADAQSAAQAEAAVQAYTNAINQDKGALGQHTRALVEDFLAQNNFYQSALKLGISQKLLTDAAIGNAAAMSRVKAILSNTDAENKNFLAYQAVTAAIDGNNGVLGTAVRRLKDVAAADDKSSGAIGRSIPVINNAAQSIKTLTTNLQNLINAEISQMQTVDGFKAGLLQLRQQVKNNGDALGQNTQKGIANRDALLSLLSSAEKAAEGSKNYGAALRNNVRDLIAAARGADLNMGAVYRLLGSLHMLPRQITTRLTLDTSGISSALGALVPQMSAAGQQAAQAYKNSFIDSMQIRSPSKVFQHYGRMLVEGLILGWKDGTAKLKDALPTSVQAALDRLGNVVAKAIAKQAALLKTAQSNLKSLLAQRAQDIGSLAGNISGSADLGGLFGTDVLGNPTVANTDVFLTGQATTIANFAKDLKWGAAHHLSPILLQEIANLGAVQGDQVLKQFMSGQSSIATANAAEATIQKYSTGGATAVEDALYAKRVAKDRAAVHENTIELRNLTRALHAELRRAGRQAAQHITIDAKTGRPVVDRKFIEDIIHGIRREQRIAGRLLLT